MGHGIFDVLVKAKTTQKSDSIRDGEYLFCVQNLFYRNLEDGLTFIAEMRVVESRSKGDLQLATAKGPTTDKPVLPNPVGSIVGFVQKVQKFKSAPGNAKAFILALFGASEAETSDEEFGKTLQDLFEVQTKDGKTVDPQIDQPARGMLVKGVTYRSTTKGGPNAGNINTYLTPIHVPGQTPEAIAKRRSELGLDFEAE